MTVSTTANKVTYTGNGATTSFAYTFPILNKADLVVILTKNGIDTEISNTLYSATGVGTYTGGAVTYPLSGSPITASQQLTILRRLSAVQDTDLTNQSTIYADVLERAIDRIVMLAQQNAEKLTRALVFSVADNFDEITLPGANSRAGKYLTFDANGNPSVTQVITAGTLTISAFWTTMVALNDAALSRAALGIGVTGTLGQANADTILGNPTGVTADPSFNSLVSYLARINDTRGAMLRRGASAWEHLALGSAGQLLGSDGTDLTYVTPPVGEGQYRNLAIDATSDTAVTVTASYITLANASNNVKLIRSVNATIGTATSGVNGLDTGAVAANTWYAVWIIHNPTSNTTAAMLSTSSSSPTMPTGYTYKHRVGWVRTRSAAANLRRSRQRNAKAQYIVNATDTLPTLIAGSVTVLGVDVPSTAIEIGASTYTDSYIDRAAIAPNATYTSANALAKSQMNAFSGAGNTTYNSDVSNVPVWFVIEGAVLVSLNGSGAVRVFGWVDSI